MERSSYIDDGDGRDGPQSEFFERLLLRGTQRESTVGYPGIGVDDALEIAEQTEV